MIVLDTHAWLWWLHEPERLSAKARKAILAAEHTTIAVSAISVWEVAVKTQLGKLAIPMDIFEWFEVARRYPGTVIEPVTPQDAIASTLLPGEFHRDPADRIIVAVARRHAAPLVTCDRRIIAYPHVETLW